MNLIVSTTKNDEVNHQGRLIEMIMKLDPSQMDSFNAGLEQKD